MIDSHFRHALCSDTVGLRGIQIHKVVTDKREILISSTMGDSRIYKLCAPYINCYKVLELSKEW